ncbi:MAG: hypothetical protein J1F31_06770 [Erysipelotrichales bacterium]|nr:hypothetical protein [Erysipelotrichales bacterium]
MKKYYKQTIVCIETLLLLSIVFIPFICIATGNGQQVLISYDAPISFVGYFPLDLLLYPYCLLLIALLIIQFVVKNKKAQFITSLSLINVSFVIFIFTLFLNSLKLANALCITANILIFLLFLLTNFTLIYLFVKTKKI